MDVLLTSKPDTLWSLQWFVQFLNRHDLEPFSPGGTVIIVYTGGEDFQAAANARSTCVGCPNTPQLGGGMFRCPLPKWFGMVWHTFSIFHICRLQWNCFHSPKIIQWEYCFFEVDQEIIATMQEQQYAHDWYLFHAQPALGQTAKLPSNHEESSNIMFDEQ